MVQIIKIAWRNLWRNKRRTLITAASVFFGVILSALMGSMQEGSYTKMVDNVVRFYSGFIQIQEEEYWENKSINNSFRVDDELHLVIDSLPEITHSVKRLENFALASVGNITKGVMVVGTQPVKEAGLTSIDDKIIDGSYLKENDDGILLGFELAKSMKVNIGDTLVLLGQGYHGTSAAGKFPVRGLIKHFNPEYNRTIVYMELDNCQYFYSAGEQITSIAVMVKDNREMKKVLPKLRRQVSSPLVVKSWEEMYPAILQQIDSDRTTALFSKVILYMVIAFGIFGTIMMMIAERKHEFGVMVAIGMPKLRLALIVAVETIFIGALGVVAGLVGSFPVVGYFYSNPVPLTGNAGEWMMDLGFEPFMFFAWDPLVFINQMLVVFVITLVIAVYPVEKILRFREIDALKD